MRDKHVYILGKPGMGKSTLMLSMIRQDILNGKGVALIDPHGDLAESVLRHIPRERIQDTVYFNPLVTPIGINLFKASTEEEKRLIAGDLFLIFQRLTGTGGVRMDAVIKRAIQLLLEIPGATFHDLYRLFTDDYFRHQLVGRVQDEGLKDFWTKVWTKYPHPATEEPLVTRLSEFDSNKSLRSVLSTSSSLDFYSLIQQKRIFIANISKGLIGVDTSPILGTLLVSQFQLAGFKQASLPESKRVPCYLFIDEFQNFRTSAFNEIVIESRKYQLCLTLANQALDDLDTESKAIVDKCETNVFFRLVHADAKKFGSMVGQYIVDDLMNLNKFEAIVRPGKPNDSKKIPVERPPSPGKGFRQEIIEHTLRSYPPLPPSQVVAHVDDDVSAGLAPD